MYVSLRDRPVSETSPRAHRVATTVVLLGVVSLLTDVSSEMVAAVLPLYLTAQVGLGMLAYGFVDGLYQGVSALVRIARRLGRRPRRPAQVGGDRRVRRCPRSAARAAPGARVRGRSPL